MIVYLAPVEALTVSDRCSKLGLDTLGPELRELAERWERAS